jgi:hypothetical protein
MGARTLRWPMFGDAQRLEGTSELYSLMAKNAWEWPQVFSRTAP